VKLRWRELVSYGVAAVSVAVFAVGGHFAAEWLIRGQQTQQLRELTRLALRRSEVAVDFGAAALDELAADGPMSCNPGSLQAVRLHVYQRGAVKDIRAVRSDGSVLCSAYSETLEFDKIWPTRAEMLPALDARVRLFRVDQFFGSALGVLRDVDTSNGLVAILGVSGALFDIMPDDLHDQSDVALELNDGRIIARTSSAEESPGAAGEVADFAAASETYPLGIRVRVAKAALAGWHREPYLPIMALAFGLGGAFGLLLLRAMSRPASPVAELDRALAAGEFVPYVQPIFDLADCRIVGGEVLVRWIRPDGTMIPPTRFIELAESSGRIAALTWSLVERALGELQPLLGQRRDLKLSFNISPSHFVADGFVAELRQRVLGARVAPRQIVLEITEREGFGDLDLAAAVVAEAKDRGFRVALDDVGIGHSGLSHIQRLRPDILKIDKLFVDALDRDPAANAVIEMLVRLAGGLGMTALAEGIEQEWQAALLEEAGVDEGQGYLVAPALTVADFVALLDARAVAETAAARNVA